MKCETQPFDIEDKVRQDCYNRGYEQGRKNPAEEIVEYIEKLQKQVKEYQDKIEQGTLVELPCKVGDWIWVVCGTISEYQISEFWYDGIFFVFKCTNVEYVQEHRDFSFFDERIGKTVFLTREEAEKRLKELQK